MRLATTKYKLWHIMLAITALAGLFGVFGGFCLVEVLKILTVLFFPFFPILLAPSGRKIQASAWTCSLHPLLILASLYATWFMAWWVLGHQPRASLDDPRSLSPIVDVLYVSTRVLWLGVPAAVTLFFPLMLAHNNPLVPRSERHTAKAAARLVIPIVVWASFAAILTWGLFGAGKITSWFMNY